MSSGPVVESEDSSAQANLAVTSGWGKRRITTPVIHGTLTPRWNCELTFPLPSSAPRDGTTEALTLTIHHRRTLLALPDRFLGTVRFRLEDVIKKQDGNKDLSKPSNLPPHSLIQPHSQSHFHFQPSSICTKSETRCSPPSVQPVVERQEPNHSSCGEENSGVLDSVPPPSAPASPQEPAESPECISITTADSPDCISITTAYCSNTFRAVSYFPASIVTCETGDLEDGQEASLLDPGGGHSSHQGPLEETSTAGSTIGTQTSSNFQMFPFQHSQSQGRVRRVSFRSSFRSRLRRLRYRLDSGERRTLRLPVCSRVFSRLTSPPYDRFPKTDVSERPQGFLARLFPCLGKR
ncbi:hypothetical protein J4Q44_G00310460 [Coregonus suidteri]|uniref:C2 domain-containing protein n=1 Tax=Coregonus suidteri TaxID=861788 RepID=A0AAN8L0I1_9TELE